MVVRWRFDDPITSDSAVFEVNPNSGGSPQYEKQFSNESYSIGNLDPWFGDVVLFETSDVPLELSFSGVILSESHYTMFVEWFNKQHPFWMTDDLGRSFKIYIRNFRPKRVWSAHHGWRHSYEVDAILFGISGDSPGDADGYAPLFDPNTSPGAPPPIPPQAPPPPPPPPSPGVGNCITPTGPSTGVGTTGTYTDANWPTGSFYNLDVTMTPEVDPTPPADHGYFYSHQFWIEGSGTGGYLGIQWNGQRPDSTIGKLAIFSIWDALDAQGGDFHGPFGGEGEGYTCRINYDWIAGHSYRLRLWSLDRDGSNNLWWGAWIKDLTTNVERSIGQILVPAAWGNLSGSSIVWTEHFYGDVTICEDIPYSSCIFSDFYSNARTHAPTSLNRHFGPSQCMNSRMCLVGNGVRQEIGYT